MPNIDLVCCNCQREFFFKEKDQEFYAKHGYDLPKRCWDCRQERKKQKQEKALAAIKKP